ncbi:MAG: GNAT family N-acetyltransferase [Anaerolineae bacterium]|nr:GNAT family N-acetyltransferase [Anaerolineae bacterium]
MLPETTLFPQFTWRPLTPADAYAMHQTAVADIAADGADSAQTVEELQPLLEFLQKELPHDSLAAFTADGTLVAMALLFLPPAAEGSELRFNASGTVHHAYRGQGIGTFILSWIEARARQKAAGRAALIQTNCRDHNQDRIALFTQQGFTATRYFYRMQRDLHQPIPNALLAEGLQLRPWQPELDNATRLAFNDSFEDHFGFFPVDEEIWRVGFSGKPEFRGDLTRLALDDAGNVIGFCICSVSPGRNAQTGWNEGILEDIGVIRGWRKKGIASALIVAAMHALKEAGLDKAALGVDTENPTGALRLYENLGFYAMRRSVTFTKAL